MLDQAPKSSLFFKMKKHYRRWRQFLHNLPYVVYASYAQPGKELMGEIQISLLLPTRARPEGLSKTWHSALATADNPETIELVCYIDHDDCAAMRGLRLSAKKHSHQVRGIIGPRTSLSNCWNVIWRAARGDIYMMCSDDVVFRSQGWDTLVKKNISTHKDNIAFVYGRDGVWDEQHGTLGFVHRNWAQTLGYFVPTCLFADGVDNWLNEVAERIDRKYYVPEIYTEHRHFCNKKGIKDGTYMERIEMENASNKHELWNETENERIKDAKKLQTYINSFNLS